MLTQTELARLPGSDTFHLTNKSLSSLLVYIAKKEEIGNDKKRSKIIKFLIDKRKYDAMKEDLESGKLEPNDVWLEFGKKLGLEGYIGQQKRVEVDEEMDVEENVEENKQSNVEEEGEKKEAIVEGEQEETMEQSLAEQCSEEEMVRRVQEDTVQPDMVTNSLVIDVVRLQKKVETLQPSAATDFIIRSLGLVTNSGIKWKIWNCMKYTSARVSGRGEELHQPWLYLDTVTSIASDTPGHPLISLITRLQEIKKVATACLQCSSPPQYYCVRCVTAVYCSTDCMVEHWEEGHYMECGAWTDIIHSVAGLIPPPTDITPALRAACRARARAQSRVHTAVTEYVDAVNREEESREREEQVWEETARQKLEIARLGCQV